MIKETFSILESENSFTKFMQFFAKKNPVRGKQIRVKVYLFMKNRNSVFWEIEYLKKILTALNNSEFIKHSEIFTTAVEFEKSPKNYCEIVIEEF